MIRKVWVMLLVVAAVTLVPLGCFDFNRQLHAQTANAIAQSANAALPILEDQCRQEGYRAIDAVHRRGGTEREAEVEIQRVLDRWRPIWDAWEALRVAQDAWATVIEQGGDETAALAGLQKAYCGLMQVWPEELPATPLAPIQCYKEQTDEQ